jgi:hypothetical protein
MADSLLSVIVEMVLTILQNAVDTIGSLWGLLLKLLGVAGGVSATGTTGFLVAMGVLFIVLFFLGKFVLKSAKTIIILLLLGAALLAVLFLA